MRCDTGKFIAQVEERTLVGTCRFKTIVEGISIVSGTNLRPGVEWRPESRACLNLWGKTLPMDNLFDATALYSHPCTGFYVRALDEYGQSDFLRNSSSPNQL
jgi:hypothetical protein